MQCILFLLSTFSRLVLMLRYRLQINGLNFKELRGKKGLLFLPNHPSKLDSFLIFLLLCQNRIWVRPIGVEYIFQWAWMRPILKKLRAIPIPSFRTGYNQYKMVRAEQSLQLITKGLKQGENFLLFPSGKTKKTGAEILGGASGAYSLIQECPEAQIILIRITGLWGSSFSKVPNEKSSEIKTRFFQGVKAVLKNFIFFTPKRKVTIQIEKAPAVFTQKGLAKIEFNRLLEKWYNQYPDEQGHIHPIEPLKFVPFHFWEKAKLRSEDSSQPSIEEIPISSRTEKMVYDEIARILNQPALQLSAKMNLSSDLGMDSLNLAELLVFLSKKWRSNQIFPDQLQTVQDVLEIAEKGAKIEARKRGIYFWPKEKQRPPINITNAKTIPEAILELCQKRGSLSMCGDDFAGIVSYKKFQRAVRVLAKHFEQFSEERIAILLPASASTYIIVIALQLAGKVPVMLNWTLGPRYLEQMMDISGAKRILTSWAFIDRLQHVDFGKWVHQLQFLEHIRSDLSLKTKLSGIFGKVNFRLVKEEAVILFTSGSEAAPKGVPLTHANILTNFHSLIGGFPFHADDIPYSALPPFHSLGFTVVGIFPLLMGIRVAFYPDPTDALALAEGAHRWRVTHLALAPTFLKALFSVAKREHLESVRIFVSGGDRTPQELFDHVAQEYLSAKLVEGYGVTECSPCIALGDPNSPRLGLGKVLPGIDILTIHPETEVPLPLGAEGEVCVSGPNVFKGYLGNVRSPFIEIEGKRWYRTGDIGHVDGDRTLTLSGRLKRFVKLGGEMISLAAIEEVLSQEILKEEIPTLAVGSKETLSEKAQIILFARIPFSRERANEILQQAGFSHLVKIDQVVEVQEIPISATGKIDYKKLLTMR